MAQGRPPNAEPPAHRKSSGLPARLPSAKPRLYDRVVVLCIGINDYASPTIKDLSYAEPDARGLSKLFGLRYGYEVVLLLGKDATRTAIGTKLREFAGQLGKNDALIVYFAGHGQVIELPSHGRAGYLIPYDATLDLENRANPDEWAAQALGMRELVDFIREMNARHVLLVADACCSGFLTKRGAFAERKDLHLLLAEPSRVVLAAATQNQGVGENWKTGHGYFTGALLGRLGSPEAASVTDVFVDVREQVSRESKGMLPQMANLGDGDGEFVFIPLEVPERDIQIALEGGLEHALEGVYKRSMQRVAQRTRLEDVHQAFQAIDYRFSSQPRVHEKLWQEKSRRFRENATTGDVLAMAGLHYCYSKGLGTGKDEGEALRWAQLAYDSGRPEGKHVYGRCLLNGIGAEQNEEAGWALIGEAADAGCVVSQLSLADRLFRERGQAPGGLVQSVGRARALYEKATEAGLAKAKEQLALLYASSGELPGIVRDLDKAIALLAPAADAGLPSSQFELANIYLGLLPGAPKDLRKATGLLTRAAQAGFAPAQHKLGIEYDQQEAAPLVLGLKQDRAQARRWFELAAGQDFAPSLIALSRMHETGVPIDVGKARRYCERAAALNAPQAFVIQGTWHADGKVYDQDDARAMDLFRRAADMGEPKGCRMVGWMYDQARGVPLRGHPQQEMIPYFKYHALHWHVRAVKLGDDPESKKALEDFHKEILKEQNLTKLGIRYASLFKPWPSRILKEFKKGYPESAKEFEQMFDIPPE